MGITNLQEKGARILTALALIAMTGYGGWLRYHDLGLSLSGDEIASREGALQSAAHTLQNEEFPLFPLLAKASLLLGDTERTLRLPSFIAGLAVILLTFFWVKRLHSRGAALAAAALMAFSPFHIFYSAFARPYALLILFALLALWTLHAALEHGRARAWLAYTAAAFLALASHSYFAPALIAMNLAAALYLLCARARGSLRRRLGTVALLAGCTLIASSFLLQQKFPVETLLAGPSTMQAQATDANAPDSPIEVESGRPGGGGRMSTNLATGAVTYRLTIFDCMEYLKAFFWNDTPGLWILLLALGVFGFVDLWWRVPALAAPLTGGLLLAPLPFFLVESGQWYHREYATYAYGWTIVLLACGLCVLPQFLARVLSEPRAITLWRRVPAAPLRPRTEALYALMLVGLAAAAAPIMNTSYLTYPVDGYLPRGPLAPNHVPIRDWQRLHQFSARVIRDGDPIQFMTPDHERGPAYTHYYLSRFLPWREEEVRLHEAFGPPTPEGIRAWARDYPFSNLWFVGYQNYNVHEFRPLLEAAGLAQLDLSERNLPRGLRLFFVGAPTRNHIANGNFEGRFKEALPEGVVRTMADAFNGPASLKIFVEPGEVDGRDAWQRMYRTAIAPAVYRLRNNTFEAWRDGAPVGWLKSGPGAITESEKGMKQTRCVALAPAVGATLLQQQIDVHTAPGHTLEVQAMGHSATPDNLHLVLRYAGPGFQEEVRAVHPGTGEWVQMGLEAKLPPETNPKSITVEIWRQPGGEGEALADNVELRVKDGGAGLDPSTPYVLSLAVRTENLRHKSGAEMVPGGRVRLSWVDAQGNQGYTDLMHLRHGDDWRTLAATFQPGRDLPTDLKELHFEAGIVDGIGTIYIDEVQLEAGTRPTPFTPGIRLPHDELMPRRDLEPHAVNVAW